MGRSLRALVLVLLSVVVQAGASPAPAGLQEAPTARKPAAPLHDLKMSPASNRWNVTSENRVFTGRIHRSLIAGHLDVGVQMRTPAGTWAYIAYKDIKSGNGSFRMVARLEQTEFAYYLGRAQWRVKVPGNRRFATSYTKWRSITLFEDEPMRIDHDRLSTWPVRPGQPFSRRLTTTGGVQPISWSAPEGLPPGVSLAADGTISGSLTASGTHSFPVRAVDADKEVASTRVNLAVPGPELVVVFTEALPSGRVGASYDHRLVAEGGSGELRWYFLDDDPVPGLTLEPDGALSGVPTQAGSYDVYLEVTDHDGHWTEVMLPLEVTP